MSVVPPPPPPPPPEPPRPRSNVIDFSNKYIYRKIFAYLSKKSPEDLAAQNAKNEAIFANSVFELCGGTEMVCYQNCKPIRQVGPTCGLVALSMMMNGQVSVERLFKIAKLRKYSINGEMFSCRNMGRLAKKALKMCNNTDARVYMRRGGLCSESVINKLFNKCFLLVPYDSDFNNYPCLKNGHKAHWALVCGILKALDGQHYAIFRQGASSIQSVCLLKDLSMSNKNLNEVSPERLCENSEYIVPEGGIAGNLGLRNRYIVIEGLII